MSQIKLKHSGGNSVIIAAPDSNPASDRTLKLPGDADGTILTTNTAVGKILQVLQNTKKDTASTNSTSFTSTGLSQTITPSSANSKILVMYSLFISVPAGTYSAGTSIIRDNTEIFIADGLGSSDRVTTFMWPGGGRDPSLHSHTFLDSPNTTSSVSYSIEYKSFYSEATVYIGRSDTSSTSVYHGTTPSSLTLMEVAP
tara:strand:- start:41 stop:637 length:597 start_codon:yes stop_codon:yes gene_type:complete